MMCPNSSLLMAKSKEDFEQFYKDYKIFDDIIKLKILLRFMKLNYKEVDMVEDMNINVIEKVIIKLNGY